MQSDSRLGISSRLVRQPAMVVLVLGSIAALMVGGLLDLTGVQKSVAASDSGVDPVVEGLKAYAASAAARYPQSHAPAVPDAVEAGLPDVATMTARLEARLAKEPGNADGWRLLGLSRAHLGDATGAADAYSRALELMPGDAELIAALHEARRAKGAAAD
jgi:cytochrome c-type biogenesis protein CcmH/NrfG